MKLPDKPQSEWTPEECAEVAAHQEACRWWAMQQVQSPYGSVLEAEANKKKRAGEMKVTDDIVQRAATIICTELAGDTCVFMHDAGRGPLCDDQNCRVWPVVRAALEAALRPSDLE